MTALNGTEFSVKNKTKTPSPRSQHSGWEHDTKLWIFGGHGPSTGDYLNEHGDMELDGDMDNGVNNQLFHFNPVSNEWTNLKCLGTVPSPRSGHASTVFGDTVWLYGGITSDTDSDTLYQLDMCSVTWKQIHPATLQPHTQGISAGTLTATRENQLVLHCGLNNTWDTRSIIILMEDM